MEIPKGEILKIKKRNSLIVDFDLLKIANAIFKAAQSVGGKDKRLAETLAEEVYAYLKTQEFENNIPTVEQVQDAVEKILIEGGHAKTAKAYILYRDERKKIREAKAAMGVEDDIKLSLNAIKVLEKRYLLKDKDGRVIETPKEMFRRVARYIAQADKNEGASDEEIVRTEEKFWNMMTNLEFLPNSPTFTGAGTKVGQLSACFVLPVGDSMEDIFEALKHTAMIHKSGGGTGFSFSRLRPKNDRVMSTKGIASGPLSFMSVFDTATETVKQGGCVSADTIISTCSGLKEINSYNNPGTIGWKPLQIKIQTDNGVKVTSQFYNNGVKPVKTITTYSGYKFTGTLNHKIRVIDSRGDYIWRNLEDVRKGDWVALQMHTFTGKRVKFGKFKKDFHFNTKTCKIPDFMNESLAEIIGYYIGDGCVSGNKLLFAIPHDCLELKDYFDRIMFAMFNLKSRVEQKCNDKSMNLIYHSKMLASWFGNIGIIKKNSASAFIPKIIMGGDKNCALAFLRGLFEADGTVEGENYVSLSSVSKKLIDETQILLLSLGIPSKVYKYEKRTSSFGKTPLYRLTISTMRGLFEFKNKISFLSKKKIKAFKRIKPKKMCYNDIIPNQHKKFREYYGGLATKQKGFYKQIWHYLDVKKSRNLTQFRLKNLIKKYSFLKKSFLFKFLANNQFYDKVSHITHNNSTLTLDLVVPETHTYIANGFVSHNTRRGANMGILRVDHPDILEFITAKEKTNKLNNFNISVAITDKFMEALENDGEYELLNPRLKDVFGTIRARNVFDLIVTMAWKNGEPGIIFIDNINRANPTPEAGEIESTNPCVTADTWIMTTEGPKKVRELIGKKFSAIVDGKKWECSGNGFFKTGIKTVHKLETAEGFELRLTKNHPLLKVKKINRYKTETVWTNVNALKPNDKIIVNNHQKVNWEGKYTEKEGYLIGLLLGDGTIKKDGAVISSWGESDGAKAVRLLAHKYADSFPHRSDFKGWTRIKGRDEYRLSTGHLKRLVKEIGLKPGRKEITEKIEKASSGFYKGMLKGFFDADGSVQGSQLKGVSIRLSQSDYDMLKAVQRMLLRKGIFSKIYLNRRKQGTSKLPDGKGGIKEYPIKPQHELVISNHNIISFFKKIGFGDSDKMKKLQNNIEKYKRGMNQEPFMATVKKIVLDSREDVFDVQIPEINAFDANGFYAHNCGEQPLLPYESCNLGSINLSKMIREVYEGKYDIDYNKLRETVHSAVHFLDNVIDMNKFPLHEIEKNTKANRKIGLGVMGFADMLIKLNIPYSSNEAIKKAEEVMKFIDDESKNASRELAKKRGAFPNFNKSIYKYGEPIRNATTTTIAPTGTLSIIANCSSGIEPLFAISFIRNIMDNTELVEVNPVFKEISQRDEFYSDELMKRIAQNGSIHEMEEIPKEVRRVCVTAHEITPEWHIRMQAAFQKYVDNAVSKTVNFPNHASTKDVEEVYILAYKTGCKGVTVYRDGSREAQVLNIKEVNKPKKDSCSESKEKDEKKLKEEEEEKIIRTEKKEEENISEHNMPDKKKIYCPECKTRLVQQEGCVICPNCNFSACSM